MKKILLGFVVAFLFSDPLLADQLRLRNDLPQTYTVVKGDTLWDISAKFLHTPWQWPEIWHVNTQVDNPHLIYPGDVLTLTYVDGKPVLMRDSTGRVFKLSPKARILTADEAIKTIPLDKINAFLSKSRIVTNEELKLAPYVVSGESQRLIVAAGDSVYIRGEIEVGHSAFGVYRRGQAYVDPETREKLGIQAINIGSGEIRRRKNNQEVYTLEIYQTKEEIRVGDRLLRQEERAVETTFFPSSPTQDINGLILAVEGGLSQVGNLDVVVLNKGRREEIEPGNVLAVYKRGGRIRDRVAGGMVSLPDERAGLVMVFRVFEKLSLGLVLEADQGLKVNDRVRNPDVYE
ncbi:MAG: peptidoglycan-binding protein [Alteromonadaceae bacterium]|nr:MAG: peptidoglycan-binding protein [Alteromonadaceae bacterium]